MDTGNGKRMARLEIQVGRLKFSGEGEQEWVQEQFEKALEVLGNAGGHDAEDESRDRSEDQVAFSKSLATYVRAKGAEGNQTRRFLVAADWLRLRGQPLTSGAVAKALADNHQRRLANPADCLNKNVAKGFCEKTKDGFFITPEGLDALK